MLIIFLKYFLMLLLSLCQGNRIFGFDSALELFLLSFLFSNLFNQLFILQLFYGGNLYCPHWYLHIFLFLYVYVYSWYISPFKLFLNRLFVLKRVFLLITELEFPFTFVILFFNKTVQLRKLDVDWIICISFDVELC